MPKGNRSVQTRQVKSTVSQTVAISELMREFIEKHK